MADNPQREVIVVGAGISGLVTAWRLLRAGIDVELLEANDTVGGCMQSERKDGFILEKGPFNVLVRDEEFKTLLDELADDVAPVPASPESKRRFLLRDGELHDVPMGPAGLVRTRLLSGRAKVRLLRGMLWSARSRTPDPTIAEAAERRLGPEIAETFISSIVAGVFGGDSRRLSLKACFPKAWQFDRLRRSPLAYEVAVMRRKRKEAALDPGRDRYKGLISFGDGLQGLADGLARCLGPRLKTGCRVESIEHANDGYRLRLQTKDGSSEASCRRLVLATPKDAAARLLEPLAADLAKELGDIESASLVVLNLGYRSQDVTHPMKGYGFLVPSSEKDMPVMGVLWADSAFPHHAGPDRRVIRVFMGGPRDPHAAERSDAVLLAIADGALRDLLGIRGDPALVDICRWPSSIPQYGPGHTDRVDRINLITRGIPGLHLVGNYLGGVSVNDCVRQGTRTAEDVVELLNRTAHDERSNHSTKPPITSNGKTVRAGVATDRATAPA
jgi:oxygen-dependent protoporphyrinogen oxidase